MSADSWTDTSLMILLVAVGIIWVILSLYAFWRAGRMTDRASSLQDLAEFLDTMIKTDHRYPIWVWPDGRLQADAGALSLIGISGVVTNLEDLSGAEDIGLPKDVLSIVRSSMQEDADLPGPLVVERQKDQPGLIIDIQWLHSKDPRWPHCIMWIEESYENTARSTKQSVRALELRLKDLSRVFNTLPYPVWMRGDDNTILEVNDAYVKAVDGETQQRTLDEKLELFGRGGLSALEHSRENSHSVRERKFGVIEGQRRAFAVTHSPLDNSGTVLSIAIDVTGEEEALSELARVLESQSETLNRLRSPVAIFGPGQILRFYNSAFARLTHIPEERLSSEMSHSELLDVMRDKRRLPEQADFRGWKDNILKQYTSLLEPFEEMWHLPDGTAHRVVTQPHPLGGLLILFEDVTDRLALERSYNTLIAVQQETLDNMREGIAVFGTDGRLELSNPAFKDIWDLSDADVAGMPHLTDLVVAIEGRNNLIGDENQLIPNLAAWATERVQKNGRLIKQNGTVVECSLVPLPDGGMMLTQGDVTDSFQVEKALRERSNALEAADRLKSEFITNMSYELRTPLNSIIGFAELLDKRIFGELTDQQGEYVKDILSAADGLKHLISDVLDLAVIEAGEVALSLSQVDVADALQESAALAQDLAHKVDIILMLNIPDPIDPIEGDQRRLKQAFYNMVSSMLNFARYGGKFMMELIGEGDNVRVTISNADSGLAQRERDRLISAVEMGATPGGRNATGLDLALVRSIVQLHGGSISLEPYGEEGLALSCVLPRKQPS